MDMKLSDRVEALQGPDRLTDANIHWLVQPEDFECDVDERGDYCYARGGWTMNRADHHFLDGLGVPRYTASLDAAMTLLPEGWSVGLGDLRGYDPIVWRAHLRNHNNPSASAREWEEGHNQSPAIALTAAALRARGL